AVQLCGKLAEEVGLALRRSDLHDQIAALRPTQFAQAAFESVEGSLACRDRTRRENADACYLPIRQRLRRDVGRPRDRRAPEQRHELAPLHSVTSWAAHRPFPTSQCMPLFVRSKAEKGWPGSPLAASHSTDV